MESTQSQQVNLFNQIFNSQQIDVLGSVDNPVFITNQVCKAIGQDARSKWILQVKKDFSGAEILRASEIPTYQGQSMSVITFRGVVEIFSRSESSLAKKFRDFITELLFNLFRGKIQILVLDKELLEQENKEYLTRLALTEQSNQELEEKLSQSMQSLADLTDAIEPVLEKERTQKPKKKKYQKDLAIVEDDEDQYKIIRLQFYQMNSRINELTQLGMRIVLRLQDLPNHQGFWQACHQELVAHGIIEPDSKQLLVQLTTDATEEDLVEFVQEFYDQRKNL